MNHSLVGGLAVSESQSTAIVATVALVHALDLDAIAKRGEIYWHLTRTCGGSGATRTRGTIEVRGLLREKVEKATHDPRRAPFRRWRPGRWQMARWHVSVLADDSIKSVSGGV